MNCDTGGMVFSRSRSSQGTGDIRVVSKRKLAVKAFSDAMADVAVRIPILYLFS